MSPECLDIPAAHAPSLEGKGPEVRKIRHHKEVIRTAPPTVYAPLMRPLYGREILRLAARKTAYV